MSLSNVKMVIAVRRDLQMRKGKMAAQVAHASMMFLLKNDTSEDPTKLDVQLLDHEVEWIRGPFTKIVVGVDNEKQLRDLIMLAYNIGIECNSCTDNGSTEFHGEKTLTCAAFGPAYSGDLDELTGNLKLL